MAEKITNMEEIERLYQDGTISRATYYRARKRGYVVLDYHKPHKSEEEVKFSPEIFWAEFMELRGEYLAIASNAIARYDVWGAVTPDELVDEGAIYLIDRGIMPRQGFAHFKSYVRSLIRGKGKKVPFSLNNNLSYTEVESEDEGGLTTYLHQHGHQIW